MALSDLGGLGAREGAPVLYNWTLPNPLPTLLPWLAVLLLLALKPNRCAEAWWIWVPVGCLAVAGSVLQSGSGFVAFDSQDTIGDCVSAAGFGLAAVWLIASSLGWKHRVVAWVGSLLAMASFGLLSFALRQCVEGFAPEAILTGILLVAGAAVISLALTLAGLACRGRYRPFRLCLWLLAALLVVWLVVISPFFVLTMVFSPGRVPLSDLAVVVLPATALSFGVVLPFLLLSYANAFYRARLAGLLHLGRASAPPVLAPSGPRAVEVAGS